MSNKSHQHDVILVALQNSTLSTGHIKPPQLTWGTSVFNSSSTGQNGRHIADDIVKRIFVNETLVVFF